MLELNYDKIKELMTSRGWSEVKLARKIGMDYSYVYRVLRKQRGIGRKFIAGVMAMCEKEGLEFREYVQLH